ncbi:hypothetical protein BHE97_15900 [Aeromicrobium sp. PE09-221]|uniref:hypothetical protein n=1 Tax=Aeromicrobium sp. PE09-221 TaxID=1898043 RepID=UPI000B3EC51C|nr:hypothetical protein [Aeromicrobium sp. PE09-221]OUZ07858.1 hypothetical protein BHE97_15900 [Aeromicrobium sp. PE09-221]
MSARRLLLGAVGDEEASIAAAARRWRDAGAEVVYLGAGVTADVMAATAISEDVAAVVVDAQGAEAVRAALARAGADDIEVTISS